MAYAPQNRLQPKTATKLENEKAIPMTFPTLEHKEAIEYMVRIRQLLLEIENIHIKRILRCRIFLTY